MPAKDEWLLTPERVAVHRPSCCAVVADLHLGYGQARRRGGDAVPAPNLSTYLAPLATAMKRAAVDRLIVAGDLFEDGRCEREALVAELLDWVASAGVELVAVVRGNHDRGLGKSALAVVEQAQLGEWQIVHGDGARPPGPVVQGHEHPCLRWRTQISAPCYLVGADHLVLPAFSPDAAGVNVLREARWSEYRCWVIAGAEVLDFGAVGTFAAACGLAGAR
jgi:putative SbcD/Mre11-related phosphoesterase